MYIRFSIAILTGLHLFNRMYYFLPKNILNDRYDTFESS